MSRGLLALTFSAALGLAPLACVSTTPPQETNSQVGSGGTTAAGGTSAAGAPAGSGGTPASGTGGSPSAGGGAPAGVGGVPAQGGAPVDAPPGETPAANPGTPSPGGGLEPPEVANPPPTDLAQHRFKKTIRIDTAGSAVMGDVAKFPLPVQLDAMNFDFATAKSRGEDVRFSTADGTLLPYSIELWDADKKRAALWVKVDVKGNDANQSIVMHWGNANAVSAASSKSVFSLADGFLGVYHLNQDGSTTKDAYRDASENAVHGTGVMLAPGSLLPARVGDGTVLLNSRTEYKGQWIRVDDPKAITGFHAGGDHPITASIWAYANSFPAHSTIGKYETPMSKGDMSWTLQRDYQSRWEACTEIGYHACAFGPNPVAKRWYHLLMVQTKQNLTLYVDGRRTGGAPSKGTPSDHPLGIGQQTQKIQKREWDGVLDEARVMSVARDANWAKLDFESQREGSKLLVFGATEMK